MAKKPVAARERGARKTPDAVRDPSIVKDQPISWRLGLVDWGGDHGWRTLDLDHVETLHTELKKLEGRTFFELERSKKIKDIPVDHFRRKPKERLRTLGLEEAEVMWELRLPNKWRAWGLVEQAIFYFLWWDEKETVCNPPPKGERRR